MSANPKSPKPHSRHFSDDRSAVLHQPKSDSLRRTSNQNTGELEVSADSGSKFVLSDSERLLAADTASVDKVSELLGRPCGSSSPTQPGNGSGIDCSFDNLGEVMMSDFSVDSDSPFEGHDDHSEGEIDATSSIGLPPNPDFFSSGASDDQRFLQPELWLSNLESLEFEIFKGSAVESLAIMSQPAAGDSCNKVLRHFHQVLRGVSRNLRKMQEVHYCADSINVLVVNGERPDVAELVPIGEKQIYGLLDSFDRSLQNASTEYEMAGIFVDCCEFLQSLGLSSATNTIYYDQSEAERTCRAAGAVVSLLDFAMVSYSGAHLEPFNERYLGAKASDGFMIANDLIFRRRRMKCLSAYLQDKPAWVFEALAVGNNKNSKGPFAQITQLSTESFSRLVTTGNTTPIYLSTTIEEFATIWGPAWKKVLKDRPDIVLRYDVGPGHIIPWPRSEGEPPLLPGEVFCHWTVDEDDISSSGPFPSKSGHRLLIGGRLLRNTECLTKSSEFEVKMVNEGRRNPFGVNHSSFEADSQTVSVQIGGFGLNAGIQEQHKRRGALFRDDLLAAWTHQPPRHNPRVFRHWFGVEVSVCTGNARRRRLSQILGSPTVQNYLESICMRWPSEQHKSRYFDALNSSDIQSFDNLFRTDAEYQGTIANAISLSLSAILKTGIDRNNCLSAMWAPDCHEVHSIAFPDWEYSWTGILADGSDGCNVAIVTKECLELADAGQASLCRKKGNSSNRYSILETYLAVNEEAKMPEGLAKRPRRRNNYTDHTYQWDFSRLKSGGVFSLGQQGRLKVLGYLRHNKTYREPGLLTEWRCHPTSSRMEMVQETIRQNIGKTPIAKCHREHVWEHPYTTRPILIHIPSHPNLATCLSLGED